MDRTARSAAFGLTKATNGSNSGRSVNRVSSVRCLLAGREKSGAMMSDAPRFPEPLNEAM